MCPRKGKEAKRLQQHRELLISAPLISEGCALKAFEHLIASIATAFVNTELDHIDTTIDWALQELGRALRVDRCYVLLLNSDQTRMSNAYEWCAPGIAPQRAVLQDTPAAEARWWLDRVRRHDHLLLSKIADLGKDALARKRILEAQGVHALLIVPISIDGSLRGLIGFDAVDHQTHLTEEHLPLIQIAAELISGALERKKAELSLQQSELRFKTIFDCVAVGICLTDANGRIIDSNPAYEELLGYSHDELRSLTFADLTSSEDSTNDLQLYQELIAGKRESYQIEKRGIRRDGQLIWAKLMVSRLLPGADPIVIRLAEDITQKKLAEREIRYLGIHDQLTRLHKRIFFDEKLHQLEQAGLLPISIIVCDINDLGHINKTYGLECGDHLLARAANLLRGLWGREQYATRYGDDEFAVVLPGCDEVAAQALCRRIRAIHPAASPSEPPIGFAVGAATKSSSTSHLREICRLAEERMYRHKLLHTRSPRHALVRVLLQTLHERSDETEAHASRIQLLAAAMAEKLELTPYETDELLLLGALHDIGKVGIPDHTLGKPGPLSQEEWVVMKSHCEIGQRIVSSTPKMDPVARAVLAHHECWDGGGYPLSLAGYQIPLISRIIAIIDSYDVMTHDRPYRKARAHDEALAELRRCAGSQFDPVLVEVFVSLFGG